MDLNELINKIGDRDLKLIELIKNNPVSKLKTASLQKNSIVSSEYYFDIDNIISLKDNNNQAVYIIPAYKSSNTKDSNIYSISINITNDFIDAKLNILKLKEDGTQEHISRNFDLSKKTSKNLKTATEFECYCTIYYTPEHYSQATGWLMPEETVMYCSDCTGTTSGGSSSGSDFGTSTGTGTGANTSISSVWANGGGSNYGYTFNYTGQQAYVGLYKKYLPNYTFSSLQRYNITNNPEVSAPLLDFLNTDGNTQSNKNFVLSVIDAIEEGRVASTQEVNVLLNTYKIVKTSLLIENQIDDTQLDPCPKEVMEKLKKATNADIANIMTKLGAKNTYKVSMVMKPAGTYAETEKISSYNYEIRVDRDRYTNGTKLFKATSLIHEIIHAYFLSIVDDYNHTPSTLLPSFPELFEAYVKKTYPNPSDAQHKEMADKYVDAMASALQEYDANFTVPYQVYKDLAWGSLSEAPIFNKTYLPGTDENIRITNRYAAESSGHSTGQGTINQQNTIGKPCN